MSTYLKTELIFKYQTNLSYEKKFFFYLLLQVENEPDSVCFLDVSNDLIATQKNYVTWLFVLRSEIAINSAFLQRTPKPKKEFNNLKIIKAFSA